MSFATRLRHGDFITGNNPQFPPFQWRNALHGHLEVGLVICLLGIPTGRRVLQVGCGSGIALPHLSRLCSPRVMADRGMYRVSCRGMAGDLQVGLGFRPGFGQQPYPAPEPAPVQQPPQPGNAVPDYADGPSRLLPATAVSGRQRPGRRSQAAGGQPPVISVFHPGPVGQGQQRRHRQHEPMPRNPRRVSPAGLLPLPTQALDRPPVVAEGRL